MAHKVAEKLIILKDVGQGLMCRIHSLITFNLTVLESDPLVKHFANNLIKKFPELPNDVAGKPLKGFHEFKERATEIKTALEDSYRTFIDVVTYKEEAWAVLQKCADELLILSYKSNNDLTADFLSVLTQYVKLHILVTRVEQRKLMVASYSRAYHYSAGNTEPKYGVVAKLFVDYDTKFFRKLQDDCAPIADRVGETLAEFWEPINKWSNKDNLVKARVFSVLESPETMTRPPKPETEENHLLLMQYNDLCEWVLFGFLVCPGGLAKRPVEVAKKAKPIPTLALQLLQKCLSNVFTITVFRDVTLNVHKEYEVLFGYFKGPKPTNRKEKRFELSKNYIKNGILKTAREDWQGCLKRHADTRTYLRVEMETLTHFFTEFPAVMCPKFQMLLALMHLSRDEVIWYFVHHQDVIPHRLNAKKYEHIKDPYIVALIHLTMQLIELVKKYRDQIAMYYMGYLMNTDVVRAKEIVTDFLEAANLTSRDKDLITYLMDTLEGADQNHFESVRLNWYRISASISNVNTGITNLGKVTKDINQIMTQIVHRSRNVDCLDTQLRTHGSFRQLYYYRGTCDEAKESKDWSTCFTVMDCLKESLKPHSLYSPAYCISLVKIFVSSLHNVHRLCPEEHNQISKTIVKMGDGFLRYIVANGIETPIKRIINHTTNFLRAQTAEAKVIERMQLAAEEVKDGEERKVLPDPGFESDWRNRGRDRQVTEMEYFREFVSRVCGSFAGNDVLQVANVEFIPREYLIESAADNLDAYLRNFTFRNAQSSEYKNRQPIEILSKDKLDLDFYLCRPSSIVAKFKDVIYAYQVIEQHVGVNTSDIVRECLLREFYDESFGTCGQSNLNQVVEEKKTEDQSVKAPLIRYICNWYSNLFSKDIGVEFGLSYSPVYQAFFSNSIGKSKNFKPMLNGTDFTDINELNALCTLIGPYGVRALDQSLLKIIVGEVQQIKVIMKKHNKRFKILKNQFTERPLWMDSKAELTATDPKQKNSISDLDELVRHATITGCAIIFRRLIKDALHRVCNDAVPFISKAVNLAFDEIHQKVTINPDLAKLDYLAEDCGIDTTDFDHLLFDSLKQYKTTDQDRDLWHLLPEAFGISYVGQRWITAAYDVHSDSHNNNVRAIAECFYHLTLIFERITLKSESMQGAVDPEQRIKSQLERFVTNSAYSTLHMQNKDTRSDSRGGKNLTHIMLFLEQFISVTNGRLKLSFLEECFPYTTLRENYIELFHKKEMLIEGEEDIKADEVKTETKDEQKEQKEGEGGLQVEGSPAGSTGAGGNSRASSPKPGSSPRPQ